jgi:hypothetical protein
MKKSRSSHCLLEAPLKCSYKTCVSRKFRSSSTTQCKLILCIWYNGSFLKRSNSGKMPSALNRLKYLSAQWEATLFYTVMMTTRDGLGDSHIAPHYPAGCVVERMQNGATSCRFLRKCALTRRDALYGTYT